MKLKPTRDCFGVCTLTAGVEVICFAVLVFSLLVISAVSSAEPLQILGLTVPPTLQVAAGAWAFVGIPLAIMAGVGALYQVESNLRLFFCYLLASFFVGAVIPVWLLLTGSVCGVVVDREVQQMGSAFVCGFTDAFVFAWSLIIGLAHLYVLYVVWSAYQESKDPEELLRYERKLRELQEQRPGPPPGPIPLPADRARAAQGIPPSAPAVMRDGGAEIASGPPHAASVTPGTMQQQQFVVPPTGMPGFPQADVLAPIPAEVRAYASTAQGMPPASSFGM
jgi:hypothetical protein